MNRLDKIDIEKIENCYKILFHYEDSWSSLYLVSASDEATRFLAYDPVRDIGHIWLGMPHSIEEGTDMIHGVSLMCLNFFDMTKQSLWLPSHAWNVFENNMKKIIHGEEKKNTIGREVLSDLAQSAAQIDIREEWRDDTPLLDFSKELRDHVIRIGKNYWEIGANIIVQFVNDCFSPSDDCGSLYFNVSRNGKRVINGGIINHGTNAEPNFSIHT